MKRLAVILVTLGALLVPACAASASIVSTPAPTCNPWSQIYYLGPPQCYCPPGWMGVYPSFWGYMFEGKQPACGRPWWYA